MADLIDTFLQNNNIETEFQQFIEDNEIEFNRHQLKDHVKDLNRYGNDRDTKMFFNILYSINTNNPFLLHDNDSSTLNLNTKQKLNIYIISIYEQIKKREKGVRGDISHNATNFINQSELDTKFNTILDDIKKGFFPEFFAGTITDTEQRRIRTYFNSGDEYSFNSCLYELAHILRDFDGHTTDDNDDPSDKDEPYNHDYDIIKRLKDDALSDLPDQFFMDACYHLVDKDVKKIAKSNNLNGIQDDMKLTPFKCFLFLYNLVLHSIINFGDAINFKKVIGSVTGDQILAETLAKNNYGYGVKKYERKRGKNTRKKYKRKRNKNTRNKNKRKMGKNK